MSSKLIVDSWKLIAGRDRDECALRRSSLSTHNYPLSTRTAFTLIEIMIVLGIITIVAALGVPIYNALSGSRSVEAAQNQVSAYLGQARTIAINEGKSAGVMFYVDPATERTAMAIVIVGDTTLEDPDPYEKYKAWLPAGSTGTFDYTTGNLDPNDDGNTNDRTRADRVIAFTSDANSGFDISSYQTPGVVTGNPRYVDTRRYIGNFRPSVKLWRAERSHTSGAGTRPPREGPYAGNIPVVDTIPIYSSPGNEAVTDPNDRNFGNTTWKISSGKVISQYGQSEQQLLPFGIGLQVIIQPTRRSDDAITSPNTDRYVRTGIILFDPQGRLVLRDLQLPRSTTLGEYLELATDAQGIVSGVGVALYNDSQFRTYTSTAGEQTTQGDWLYGGSGTNTYYLNSPSAPIVDAPATYAAEKSEEDWLANNTVPILINRFSGSLSETE